MPVFRSKIDQPLVGARCSGGAGIGALAKTLAMALALAKTLSMAMTFSRATTFSMAMALAMALAISFCSPSIISPAFSQERSEIAASLPEQSDTAKTAYPRFGFGRYLQGDFSKDDLRRRPLLYFRIWANQPMPPVLSFLFLLFITVVASEIMPSRMEIARRYYANHYWRSFWTGIVASLLLTTLARALFVSEIGEPLAIGSLAVLQFFVLIGVAISSTLIGQTILSVVSPKRAPAVKQQWFARLAAPLVGSLLLALLLVIPPLGILPRIGIRLIMLLSFLGMGAWFRTGMGTKELGGSSET